MPCVNENIGQGMSVYVNYVDHPRPHIDIWRGNLLLAVIRIRTNEVIRGRLNGSEERIVNRYINEHRDELLEAWKDCEHGKPPKKIG